MTRSGLLFEATMNPGDVVYTPEYISKGIIKYLQPTGIILDPCRGDGSFHKNLPTGSMYCEIAEGTDFFDFHKKCDWIIGNPPYSIFKDFLEKAFELSDNVSFLVPTNKVFQRQIIMEMINKWGGIKSQIIYGSGTLIGFPFGFSVGNYHFQKEYDGPCDTIIGMRKIKKLGLLVQ